MGHWHRWPSNTGYGARLWSYFSLCGRTHSATASVTGARVCRLRGSGMRWSGDRRAQRAWRATLLRQQTWRVVGGCGCGALTRHDCEANGWSSSRNARATGADPGGCRATAGSCVDAPTTKSPFEFNEVRGGNWNIWAFGTPDGFNVDYLCDGVIVRDGNKSIVWLLGVGLLEGPQPWLRCPCEANFSHSALTSANLNATGPYWSCDRAAGRGTLWTPLFRGDSAILCSADTASDVRWFQRALATPQSSLSVGICKTDDSGEDIKLASGDLFVRATVGFDKTRTCPMTAPNAMVTTTWTTTTTTTTTTTAVSASTASASTSSTTASQPTTLASAERMGESTNVALSCRHRRWRCRLGCGGRCGGRRRLAAQRQECGEQRVAMVVTRPAALVTMVWLHRRKMRRRCARRSTGRSRRAVSTRRCALTATTRRRSST
jgi:hypothetical protein